MNYLAARGPNPDGSGAIRAVQLTDEQRQRRDANHAAWIATLVRQANDDTDPETQRNARQLLGRREH